MSTPTTFIKLDRNILSWGWFTVPQTLSVWLFILIKANIGDRMFQGTPVKRGEMITSYNSIAETCGITVDKARTAIKHLAETGEITYEGSNKCLHIRVVNYNKYQNGYLYEFEGDFNEKNPEKTGCKSHANPTQIPCESHANPNTIINKEIKKERSVCEKHAHGIFNNIFLTEDEYKDYRLRVRDIDTIIDELSEAVAAEPGRYSKGDIKAWLNKFIRSKYGRMPERRKML